LSAVEDDCAVASAVVAMEAQFQALVERMNQLELENQALKQRADNATQRADEATAAATAVQQAMASIPVGAAPPGLSAAVAVVPAQRAIDTRVMGKPPNGVRDEAHWPVWQNLVRSYLTAVDARYVKLMEDAADPGKPGTVADYGDDEVQSLITQLYYVLTMLVTEGRAAEKSLLVGTGEGLLLWRAILQEYEPQFRSRTASIFQRVVGFAVGPKDVGGSLDKFDTLCGQYRQASGTEVSQDTRSGIILRSLVGLGQQKHEQCGKIAEHLIIEADRFTSYDLMKLEIRRIVSVQRDFLQDGGQVNALGKGVKGGKAKGKGGKDGRVQVTIKFEGDCHWCGRAGHKQADCWDKQAGKPKNLGRKAGAPNQKGPRGDKGQGAPGSSTTGNSSTPNNKKRCGYCKLIGHDESECRKKAADEVGDGPSSKRKRISALETAAANLVEAIKGLKEEDDVGSISLSAVELGIGAVQAQDGKVRIGVDSGAEITVWPVDLHSEVPTVPSQESTAGVCYWGPGDKTRPTIRDHGTRVYRLRCGNAALDSKVHVADVRRPLTGVADMNDKGWDVHFMAKTGSWAEHSSGKVLNFVRTGGRFEMVVEVLGSGSPGQATP